MVETCGAKVMQENKKVHFKTWFARVCELERRVADKRAKRVFGWNASRERTRSALIKLCAQSLAWCESD